MVVGIDITAYEHVGIRISDKRKGVAFYEKLGFRVTEDFPEHKALEMENAAGVRINLIYNGRARLGNILLDERDKYPGVTHPAFVVPSLDVVIEELSRHDISLSEGPVVVGDRRRICFVRDPDGNVVEFDEMLADA